MVDGATLSTVSVKLVQAAVHTTIGRGVDKFRLRYVNCGDLGSLQVCCANLKHTKCVMIGSSTVSNC